MRASLEKLVKSAICIEMKLPNTSRGVNSSVISTSKDICFKTNSEDCLARSIYNGIVEYAVNEFEIDYSDLELEQLRVFGRKIRYNSNAEDTVKLKYGFYGEVLLDLILRCFLKTNVLLARGYLYQPIEKSEVKGFDAFHIREINGNVELWLGEAKFYVNYKTPINDVLEKISYSLSDGYINDNFLTLINWRDRFSTPCSRLSSILDRWEKNPNINIANEIKNENMTVIYPIMIAFQPKKSGSYDANISEIIAYIKNRVDELSINISNSFQYKIFFIFLPVNEVKKVKENVFKWIDTKEPLI